MRLEWAHAKFLGEGKGLVVVVSGLTTLRAIGMRRNVTEEAQGIGLVAMFLVRMGERQRPLDEGVCRLQMADQKMRLAEGEATEHQILADVLGANLFQHLGEQWHGGGHAPGQRVCCPQARPNVEQRVRDGPTNIHGAFEHMEGPGHVALAEGQQANPSRGIEEAVRVRERLGHLEPFVPENTAPQ